MPVNLLINKCDLIERVKRSPWLEKIQLENYVRENQFFNHFFISAENIREKNRDSTLSSVSVEIESPLKDIIRTILQFRDLKDKLLLTKGNSKVVNLKTNNNFKESNNNSTSSHQTDISYKKEDKKDKKSKKDRRDGSCSIL